MRKRKILLVRVPEIEYNSKNIDIRNISIGGLAVPLGITYLASVIRKNSNHVVEILDLYAEYYKEFIKQARNNPSEVLSISKKALVNAILQYKPDVVGFSALFLFQHNLVKELANIVKENFPLVRIYLGGYSTIVPQLVLNDVPSLDVLFLGEAENSIVRVLDAEGCNKNIETIDAIAYRDNKQIVINNRLDAAKDLSDLPHPNFDMLPLEKYRSIFKRNEFPIMATRSCPFSCNFCSSYLYSGKGHRKRDLDDLMKEMENLHKKYSIDFLWVRDDNFIVNKEHVKKFLKNIIKQKLTVPWCDSSGFHVNSIDEELVDLCKASGCIEIIFAIESGSERVLREIMNKNVNLDHARKMAKYCNSVDLPVQAYFVIGNPGETRDEINKTINLAREIEIDHCTFSIATPFPGTNYYDTAVNKGYLLHDSEYILGMKYMEANMCTENFSSQEIKDIQYDANIRVNFLENRLISGNIDSLEKALKKFTSTFNQYNFHVIALLMQGYLHIKLGNTVRGEEIFKDVFELLKESKVEKAYSKYIQWDTLPTNTYRKWLEKRNLMVT